MSTKNLSRSLVEGGKTEAFKSLRKRNQRRFRRNERLFCKGILEIEPSSHKFGSWAGLEERKESFIDKLGCMRKFMNQARSKRTYGEVKSYLNRKYGNKSIKSWHLMRHFETWEFKARNKYEENVYEFIRKENFLYYGRNLSQRWLK